MSGENNQLKVISKDIFESTAVRKTAACIQCGVCSASCPVSFAMEYSPRKIIALIASEKYMAALKSNTHWLCASCYNCTVHCPAGIAFTEFMYELKRIAIRHKVDSGKAPVMYKTFSGIIRKYGRSNEIKLMSGFFIKTGFHGVLKVIPLGIKMVLKGRLKFKTEKIEARKNLTKMLDNLRHRE